MSDQVMEKLAADAASEQPVVEAPVVEPDAEQPAADETATEEAESTDFTAEDREAMNKALRAERKRARDLERQVKDFQAKAEASERSDLEGQEKAVAEAVAAARAEAKADFDAQILKLRVEAKAGGMSFHDPALAVSLLDLSADADDDEIVDALKGLADERPYLVKSAKPTDVGAGPRPGKGGSMQSMTDENWFRNLLTKQ